MRAGLQSGAGSADILTADASPKYCHLSELRAPTPVFPLLVVVVCAAGAVACGGSPVKPTPPPVQDPPKITCPAPVSYTSPNGLATTVAYGTATVSLGAPPVAVSCTPASGSIFNLGQTTVTCVATDAMQRTDQCSFTVTVLVPPRILITKFMAFGDSITWGEDGSAGSAPAPTRIRPHVQLPAPETYPGALQKLLADRYTLQTPTVYNGGAPGEQAADPDALSRFSGLLVSLRPDAALIMEGANDVNKQYQAGGATTAVDAAIDNLRMMIRDAKSRNVRPYLATIPPENPLANVPARRGGGAAYVPPFNDRVRALAGVEGITLVDVYQAFNGDVTTLIGPDGLHPTAAGYAVIANTFFARLKDTLEIAAPAPTMTIRPAGLPARTGSFARPWAAGPGSRPAVPGRR